VGNEKTQIQGHADTPFAMTRPKIATFREARKNFYSGATVLLCFATGLAAGTVWAGFVK
jgi:hypothetical protein